MKTLRDILYKVSLERIHGSTAVSVNQVHFDSRQVSLNDVFVAVPGTRTDGHDYIDKALEQGAVAIVCERMPLKLVNEVTYVLVSDAHAALAQMASNMFDNPSSLLTLVGVTGTNGKTTITTLLYQIFRMAGFKCGLLSTVRVMIDDKEFPATHTTPDPLQINRYMRDMADAGVDYCFMEVSSHGIHQKRTEGLHFAGGVFSNLTHDHLDYHKTFAEYRDVKKLFFDHLPRTAFALTNNDDKNGPVMLQNTKAKKYTYALKSYADYRAQILENLFSGLVLKIDDQEVYTRLIGSFNAYNLLAVYATARLLGLEKMEVLKQLSRLESVGGRFQYFVSEGKVTGIVDYAHTPDALKNVLETINAIRTGNETLITVVGCGGDRDATKRPQMGQLAAALSTKAIFTSDNPRSEDPDAIIAQMEAGVEPQHFNKTLSVTNRRQAIKTACSLATEGDIILIAGKGHETYQEIQGIKHDFDDLKVLKEVLKEVQK